MSCCMSLQLWRHLRVLFCSWSSLFLSTPIWFPYGAVMLFGTSCCDVPYCLFLCFPVWLSLFYGFIHLPCFNVWLRFMSDSESEWNWMWECGLDACEPSNYWVFGLFLSSGVLENSKHDVSKIGCFRPQLKKKTLSWVLWKEQTSITGQPLRAEQSRAVAYCRQPASTVTLGIELRWDPWPYICSVSRLWFFLLSLFLLL
jgi:hypothetical protein